MKKKPLDDAIEKLKVINNHPLIIDSTSEERLENGNLKFSISVEYDDTRKFIQTKHGGFWTGNNNRKGI